MRNQLKQAKRIVVKVGTSTLTYDTGKINYRRIESLTKVLSDLANQGKEIVLVTSGAIGVGMDKMHLETRPTAIEEKQAAAAVGQCELMNVYARFFAEYNHLIGQILLTPDVIENQTGKEHVTNTFFALLNKGIIPVVNENDSVAVEEIKFGDNDTLSAIVAVLVEADLLIILTDIDGLYDENPKDHPDAHLISQVEAITENLEQAAGGAGTSRGTGGMYTKVQAARRTMKHGISTVIANGSDVDVIYDILDGKQVGTLFCGKEG